MGGGEGGERPKAPPPHWMREPFQEPPPRTARGPLRHLLLQVVELCRSSPALSASCLAEASGAKTQFNHKQRSPKPVWTPGRDGRDVEHKNFQNVFFQIWLGRGARGNPNPPGTGRPKEKGAGEDRSLRRPNGQRAILGQPESAQVTDDTTQGRNLFSSVCQALEHRSCS